MAGGDRITTVVGTGHTPIYTGVPSSQQNVQGAFSQETPSLASSMSRFPNVALTDWQKGAV